MKLCLLILKHVSYEKLKNTLMINSKMINATNIVAHFVKKNVTNYCDSTYLVRICYCNHKHFCLDHCDFFYINVSI